MKAVSFYKSLPIEDPKSLIDVSLEAPKPGPRDLLVEVRAISVNPVDAKIRAGEGPGKPDGQLQILGLHSVIPYAHYPRRSLKTHGFVANSHPGNRVKKTTAGKRPGEMIVSPSKSKDHGKTFHLDN